MTTAINPAKAYASLIDVAATSLENGDQGATVTVSAWDLAAVLREAGRQWSEIASSHTDQDDPKVILAAGRIDPAVRIANDLADREPGQGPTGGDDRPHLEPVR
jgi:hypothetical protein